MNGAGRRRPGITSRACQPKARPSGYPSPPHDLLFGRHDSSTTDRASRGAAHPSNVSRSDHTANRGRQRQAATA